MKKLTLVCINKNSGKFIKKSFKSFLSQDFEDFEIILLDSKSNDNSIELVQSLKSNKIKIVELDENVNNHEAFIKGVQLSNSKYITFSTSTDGYIDNEWFSKAVDILENDLSLSFIFANSIQRNLNSNLGLVNQKFYRHNCFPSHENFLPLYVSTSYHINELNCVWSTNIVKKILLKLSEKELKSKTIDIFEFLEREIISNGYLGCYINTLANYGRVHHDSITSNDIKYDKNLLWQKQKIHLKFLRNLYKNIRLKGFVFKDINSNEISKIKPLDTRFMFLYYFYRIFYPSFKTRRPIYSMYFFYEKTLKLFTKFIRKIVFPILNYINRIKFYIKKI